MKCKSLTCQNEAEYLVDGIARCKDCAAYIMHVGKTDKVYCVQCGKEIDIKTSMYNVKDPSEFCRDWAVMDDVFYCSVECALASCDYVKRIENENE